MHSSRNTSNRARQGIVGIAVVSAVAASPMIAQASTAAPGTPAGTGHPAVGATRLTGDGPFFYGQEVNNAFPTLREIDSSGDHTAPVTFPGGLMSWAPDGSAIAASNTTKITIYAPGFTDPRDVYTINTPHETVESPRWLADGSAIAFVRTLPGGVPEIWTVKPDGTGAAPLAGLPGNGSGTGYQEFDVLPDGGYIVGQFISNEAVISVWHPGQAGLSTLTTGPIGWIAASPDGTKLAYILAGTIPGHNTLEIMDLATKKNHDWATIAAEAPLVWSPDSTKIAYSVIDAVAGGGAVTESHITVQDLVTGDFPTIVAPQANTQDFPMAWQPTVRLLPPPVLLRTQEDRVGGTDRVATAIDTSQLGFNTVGTGGRQAASAVLSRSDTFADALAGSALATSKKGPLLLTGTASLDPTVAAELKRVLPAHAPVYLLGGVKALSSTVAAQVAALGFTPVRVQGPDRDATAVAVAQQITSTPHTILVATGKNFPDALAAGAVAGAQPNTVVLLSDDNTLSPAVKTYLAANHHSGDRLFGVGNQGSNALTTLFPSTAITSQFRGIDRFDTARQLATFFYSGAAKPMTVGVATGYNWPDALGGGALLGAHTGPLLLAAGNALSPGEQAYLTANAADVEEIAVFGGEKVVPPAAAQSVGNIVAGAGNWDYHLNRVAPPLP